MRSFYHKYKTPINLVLGALIFLLVVYPQLNLPYFWDELGVYARSSLYLKDHSISLLPSSCPPELSRGHPLLFSFIYAISFTLFGDGVLTGHITSLIVSAILLYTVFRLSKKYFGTDAGILSALILLVQPVFIAQSTLVLPEVMLSLFMVLAIDTWLGKKYIFYILFSSAAILVKETAIILPVVLLIYEIIQLLKRKNAFRIQLGIVLFPLIVFGVFLVIQKIQNGWYLFPLHESNIDLNPGHFFHLLKNYFQFVFVDQSRFLMSGFILFFIVYTIAKKKKIKLSPFLTCMVTLICVGLIFNSVNFYMERYALYILVAVSFFIGWIDNQMALNSNPIYRVAVGLVFTVIFFFRTGHQFNYDADPSFKSYVEIQQKAVDYTIRTLNAEDSLFANFPVVLSFEDSRYGYCDTTRIQFVKINKKDLETADHFLIADPGSYDYSLPEDLMVQGEFHNNIVSFKLFETQIR